MNRQYPCVHHRDAEFPLKFHLSQHGTISKVEHFFAFLVTDSSTENDGDTMILLPQHKYQGSVASEDVGVGLDLVCSRKFILSWSRSMVASKYLRYQHYGSGTQAFFSAVSLRRSSDRRHQYISRIGLPQFCFEVWGISSASIKSVYP